MASSTKEAGRRLVHSIIRSESFGTSMVPLIQEGCRLEIDVCPAGYGLGDIVVVMFSQKEVAHRIIFKKNGRFLLKGDNNVRADGYFSQKALLGWVSRIIYPDRTIDLGSRSNKILKYFFVCYSILRGRFPAVGGALKLSCIPWAKRFFRRLVVAKKETPVGRD